MGKFGLIAASLAGALIFNGNQKPLPEDLAPPEDGDSDLQKARDKWSSAGEAIPKSRFQIEKEEEELRARLSTPSTFRRVGEASADSREMAQRRKVWAKLKPKPKNASKKSKAKRGGR